MYLRPPDHFAKRKFRGCQIALCRPYRCHDAQILGVVDRVGHEATQLPDRVQVGVCQVQLAADGVDLRPPTQGRQRAVERSLLTRYHDTAYCEKWYSWAETQGFAGSYLVGSLNQSPAFMDCVQKLSCCWSAWSVPSTTPSRFRSGSMCS